MLITVKPYNFNVLCYRSKCIALFVVAALLLWFSVAVGSETAEDPSHKTNKNRLSDYSGEKLVYDINFMWFKNAAEGSIVLQEDGDNYVATLKAETKGFVGFFAGYVKHLYISSMNVVGENIGLRPYLFEKNIIYKKKEEKITTSLDYENRIMSWVTIRKGKGASARKLSKRQQELWAKMKKKKTIEEGSQSLPPVIVYYDILSAFYNFRTSYYGQIQKGKDFLLHVIPEKNESDLHIHVCTLEEEMKLKKEENIGESDEGYFLIIKIPKEIFKTKEGRVLAWASKDLLPLKVIVRDYIGFGDIKGTLREAVYN